MEQKKYLANRPAMNRPIILANDGCRSAAEMIAKFTKMFLEPGMKEMVGIAKMNDGVFKHDMSAPAVVAAIRDISRVVGRKIGAMLDIKTGDVEQTLFNICNEFNRVYPKIITVNSLVSARSFLRIKEALPHTQVALFSVPTDMSADECRRHYGLTPEEKIFQDYSFYTKEWQKVLEENNLHPVGILASPFSLVVCSPRELDFLHNMGVAENCGFVVPGIRDEWMPKDHQERTMGVYEALSKGASYVVMGTQLLQGNPEAGISPEESRRLTMEEIKKYYMEQEEQS